MMSASHWDFEAHVAAWKAALPCLRLQVCMKRSDACVRMASSLRFMNVASKMQHLGRGVQGQGVTVKCIKQI